MGAVPKLYGPWTVRFMAVGGSGDNDYDVGLAPAKLTGKKGLFYVGLWDILYFPLLGVRGSYLLIFFKGLKSPT